MSKYSTVYTAVVVAMTTHASQQRIITRPLSSRELPYYKYSFDFSLSLTVDNNTHYTQYAHPQDQPGQDLPPRVPHHRAVARRRRDGRPHDVRLHLRIQGAGVLQYRGK